MDEQLWWYVARSTGLVALVLTGLSVAWGLLLSTKLLGPSPSPKWTLHTHRWLAGLTVTFTGVHLAGLVADSYVHFGWAEVLVPFASDWQPGAVAWGVVGLYLMVAIQASSLLMRRLPRRWWRGIHQLSFPLFWVSVVHGIQAGTDADSPLFLVTTGAMVLLVVFLSVVRALAPRRETTRPSATRLPPPSGPPVATIAAPSGAGS